MALRVTNSDCTYTVRPGDTQAEVCRAFGVSVGQLRAVNPGLIWRGGARVSIPGHECLMPRNAAGLGGRGRGMGDASPSTIPASLVPAGARVKIQVTTYGSGLGAAQTAAATASLTQQGIQVDNITNGTVVSFLLKKSSASYLNTYAWAVWLALDAAGIPVSNRAGITAAIFDYGAGQPTSGGSPVINTGISSAPVNPGDQVKVTLQASSFTSGLDTNDNRATRIANLLAGIYQVDGVDVRGVGSFGGYVQVLVTATRATTLAYIAADVNRAVSAVYSVSQTAGSISAQFYTRAVVGSAAPTPGVQPGAIVQTPYPQIFGTGPTAGNPNAPATPGILDGLTNALGLSTGIPATGLIVAVVAGVVILITLKT